MFPELITKLKADTVYGFGHPMTSLPLKIYTLCDFFFFAGQVGSDDLFLNCLILLDKIVDKILQN